MSFQSVCHIDEIIPGTGICALVNEQHVAIFRPSNDEQVFAISNIDPFFHSSVLSRGLICQHQDALWVASPLKKQRFNLATGECMEDARFSVSAYQVRVVEGRVEVAA